MSEVIPYYKQFIIQYPPGKTAYNEPTDSAGSELRFVNNSVIAERILQELQTGGSVIMAKLKEWRISQRRENGQFEEIFPDCNGKPISCNNCDLSFFYVEGDIVNHHTGKAVECPQCRNMLML